MTLKELIKILDSYDGLSGSTRIMVYAKKPSDGQSVSDSTDEYETIHYGSFDCLKDDRNLTGMYDNREIEKWSFVENGVQIVIAGSAYRKDQKFSFEIGTVAEGYSSGRIVLTWDQAVAVDFASNTDNWSVVEDEGYSGSFYINLHSAVPVD